MSLTLKTLTERRKTNPGPMLLKWLSGAFDSMWRTAVLRQKSFDEVCVEFAAQWCARAYTRCRRFVLAHALGPVWGKTLQLRRAQCSACIHRRPDRFQVVRCWGHQTPDGSCDCPKARWWPFSRLGYQILLRNRICPQGRFYRGSRLIVLAPETPRIGADEKNSSEGENHGQPRIPA